MTDPDQTLDPIQIAEDPIPRMWRSRQLIVKVGKIPYGQPDHEGF